MKLLGFSFYHKKGEKGINVHGKSIASYKDKVREFSRRRKTYAMSYRIAQLNKLNMGWGHYFKLSDATTVFKELTSGFEVVCVYVTGRNGSGHARV